MNVTFRRIGARRYEILVNRERAPQLLMHPAIGWDDQLPHDLLHFVAEAEWGIDDGIFGQVAAGGDAGTFVPTHHGLPNKWKHRSENLRKAGKGMGRSERLAAALQIAWQRRHGLDETPHTRETYDVLASQDAAKIAGVLDRLDELAARWHELRIGESITLEWPRAEGRQVHAAARRTRRDRHSRLRS